MPARTPRTVARTASPVTTAPVTTEQVTAPPTVTAPVLAASRTDRTVTVMLTLPAPTTVGEVAVGALHLLTGPTARRIGFALLTAATGLGGVEAAVLEVVVDTAVDIAVGTRVRSRSRSRYDRDDARGPGPGVPWSVGDPSRDRRHP